MSDFKGKVVLITGTARGCGQVLAEAFAGAGARVVACDRDAEAGERVAERIRAASGEIDFSHADVSVEGEVEGLVAEAIDRHGRLDVAVNNAGRGGRVLGRMSLSPDLHKRQSPPLGHGLVHFRHACHAEMVTVPHRRGDCPFMHAPNRRNRSPGTALASSR